MQRYELLYILPQQVADTEVAALAAQVAQKVRDAGATIVHEETLGRRKLAYPIGQSTHGTYVLVQCDAEPTQINTLEQALKLMHEILRFSMLKIRVKTTEEIERERAVQERLAKQMSAAAQVTPATPTVTAEPAPATPQPQLSTEELAKKLDEILEKPEI